MSYPELRRRIVTSQIYFHSSSSNYDLENIKEAIEKISDEEVFLIYSKIVLIFERKDLLSQTEAKDTMSKLVDYLIKKLNIKKNDKDNNNNYNSFFQADEGNNYNFLTDLPHWQIKHLVMPHYIDNSQFRSNTVQEEIIMEKLEHFMTTQRLFDKGELVKRLKFSIIGGSIEMQIFCQNLGALFEAKPDLISTVDYRVYIVPFHRSALAHFISNNDIWYMRNVHSVFKEPRLMPISESYLKDKYGLTLKNKQQKQKHQSFAKNNVNNNDIRLSNLPLKLLDSSLQNYVNYANCYFNLSFLKADCYQSSDSNRKSHKNIFYFCESFQIGQEANRMMSGISEKRMRNVGLKEIFRNEGPIKNIELLIKYGRCGPTNTDVLEEIEITKKIVKLGVYNLPPIHGVDPARKSHPLRNPLMSFLDSGSHKSRMNLVGDKNFVKNDRDIQEALCDSFYVYSYVGFVEICALKGQKGFPVLIDGRLYGDFQRIRVERLKYKNGKTLEVPIATFLNIRD